MRQIAQFITTDTGERVALSMDGQRAVMGVFFGFSCYEVIKPHEGDPDRRFARKIGQAVDRESCLSFLKGDAIALTPPILHALFEPIPKRTSK